MSGNDPIAPDRGPTPRPAVRPGAIIALILFVVTGLLYLPTLRAGFVYDDVSQIEIDGYVHDPRHLPEVLSLAVMRRDVIDNNRPVMILSLMIDSVLWGRNPMGYHLTSVLLHAACVALLFGVVRSLLEGAGACGGDAPRSWWRVTVAAAAALLLAVHPLCTEAVSNIASREDVLVTLGTLGALAAAMKAGRSRSRRASGWWAVAAVVASFLAVASKESGVAAPVLLLGYALLLAPPGTRKGSWAIAACSGVAVLGFLVARFTLGPHASEIFVQPPARLGGTFSGTLLLQPRIEALRTEHLFWPGNLSADYGPFTAGRLRPAPIAWALLGLAVAAALLAAWRSRVAALGVLLVVAALAPVSNLVPIYVPLADRYSYAPLAGVAMIVAGVLGRWRPWRAGAAALAAWGVALVLLAAGAVERQGVWHDELALWRDAAAKNPSSAKASTDLAWALTERGEYDAALREYVRVLRLSDGYAGAWADLALCLEAMGRPADAERAYRDAVALDTSLADPVKLAHSLRWRPRDMARFEAIGKRTGLWGKQ